MAFITVESLLRLFIPQIRV